MPANRTAILARKALATATPSDFGPPYPPCGAVHPWVESCMAVPLPRLWTVFQWGFPIYGALHLIPLMLFKRSAFLSNPLRMIWRAAWGTIRSSAFLASFVVSYQCEHTSFPYMGPSSTKVGFSLVLPQALPACPVIVPNGSQGTTDHTRVLWFQVLVRVGRAAWCAVASYGREEKTWRVGDVCFTQGTGERMVNRPRERVGIQDRGVWGDDRES